MISKLVLEKGPKLILFINSEKWLDGAYEPISHTVRNLHFLSKNSIFISQENCRFFFGWKICENVAVLDFLGVDNFNSREKLSKMDEKLMKMLGICTF